MKDPKKDQKALWQQEKEQLKADLANRQKSIQKNPVALKFGPSQAQSKPQYSATPQKQPPKSNGLPDDFLRRQIGLI